jgi:UDP-glucuronate decarboxylase
MQIDFRIRGCGPISQAKLSSTNRLNSKARDAPPRERILITGGAGFLGSHLCERLLAEGNDTLCVDNYFFRRKDNIAQLLGNKNFEAFHHDVTLPLYVEVDEIYNLACPASPIHYQFDPVQTTRTCVIGAINMLGLAKRLGAKILHSSTSEVYGDPTVPPANPGYRGNLNPLGPRACYDGGKGCTETLFFDAPLRIRASVSPPPSAGRRTA